MSDDVWTADKIECAKCGNFDQCDASPHMFFAADKIGLRCRECKNVWAVDPAIMLVAARIVAAIKAVSAESKPDHDLVDPDSDEAFKPQSWRDRPSLL